VGSPADSPPDQPDGVATAPSGTHTASSTPSPPGILIDPAVVETEAGPATSSLMLATWALFLGLGFMLVGAGLFGTLITVRAELSGSSSITVGALAAAYYAGFLIGSRTVVRILGSVGHIRVYAALASVLAAAILAAGLTSHPLIWIVLRLLAGACLAGQYVVSESWLNHLVTNSSRGRLLSTYTVLTVSAFGAGQAIFAGVDPDTLTGFGIAAILISTAVVPVMLSEEASPPIVATPERLSLRDLWSIAPTGVVTSLLVGITHGAFSGLIAIYAARSGLSVAAIAVFVALPTVGSLVLSVAVSGASDGRDRRIVGAVTAVVAASAAGVLLASGPRAITGLIAVFVIGGMTFPLYSIAGAYTNDWVPTAKLTAASSQLVMLFGAGAMFGPVIGATVMAATSPDGFAWTTVVAHGVIATFLGIRVLQHPTETRAKPWNEVPTAGRPLVIPATAVAMGRRLRPWRRRPPIRPGMTSRRRT
jgi:MFS family permease